MFKLSIVIPCFERSEYLREAISSVLHSITKSAQMVEVIVLDNASTNNEIRDIAESFSQVQFIRNHTNIGLFGNWNKAFKVSQGDYVCIIGDDDFVHEDFVNAFFYALQNKKFDLFYSNFKFVDENGKKKINNFRIPFGELSKNEVIEYANKYGLGLPTISMIYRKSLFKLKGFDEINFGSNDWVYLYTSMPWEISYGDERTLVYYRKHNKGASDRFGKICLVSIFYLMDKNRRRYNLQWFWSFARCSKAFWDLNQEEYKDNKYIVYFASFCKSNFILNFMHILKLFNYLTNFRRILKRTVD